MKKAVLAILAVASVSLMSATAASARDGCGRGFHRGDDGWCRSSYRAAREYYTPRYGYRASETWRPADSFRGYYGSGYYGGGYSDYYGYGDSYYGW